MGIVKLGKVVLSGGALPDRRGGLGYVFPTATWTSAAPFFFFLKTVTEVFVASPEITNVRQDWVGE